MLRALMSSAFALPPSPPKLGRWCLPTAPAYANTCNQERKAQMALEDNDLGSTPLTGAPDRLRSVRLPDHSECPVSRVFLGNNFGM